MGTLQEISFFDIDGDLLAVQGWASGTGLGVYAYNIRTNELAALTSGAGNAYRPRVSGNRVAWSFQAQEFDARTGSSWHQPSDVYLFEIGTPPAPGSTPLGTNVLVTPVDPTTNTSPVTLTFGSVSAPGTTTVTTSGTGAPPTSGFRLGNPPVYYELHTTATFTNATVCITYDEAQFRNEGQIKLLHREADGTWRDVTRSLDTAANTVCGLTSSFSPFLVAEANRAPAVRAVTLPTGPAPVNTMVSVQATFTEPDAGDTHAGAGTVIAWGDGTTSSGSALTITEPSSGSPGSITGTHTYTTPGIYTVTVTVDDGLGGSAAKAGEYVVVYDPEAGFVTGGGWIHSVPGAFKPNEALQGRATFGFVSRYERNATRPSGNTQF